MCINYLETGHLRKKKRKMDKTVFKTVGKILSVIHRLIEFVARWLFLAAAYITGSPEVMPQISNAIVTLRSTQALAIMIRLKKVS